MEGEKNLEVYDTITRSINDRRSKIDKLDDSSKFQRRVYDIFSSLPPPPFSSSSLSSSSFFHSHLCKLNFIWRTNEIPRTPFGTAVRGAFSAPLKRIRLLYVICIKWLNDLPQF